MQNVKFMACVAGIFIAAGSSHGAFVSLGDPAGSSASSEFPSPGFEVENLYDGSVTFVDIGTTANQGGGYAGAGVGPHVVVFDMGSNVTFNSIWYAQRGAEVDAVGRMQFWVTDTDPGAASTSMAILNTGLYCDLTITNVSNANLTQYDCGGSMSGRYVVMRLIAHSVGNPGGRALVLGYDASAPTDPLIPAITLLGDPVSSSASSEFPFPGFEVENLYDGSVTSDDIGTSANQGSGYAGAGVGPHVVVYDMGSSITFNSILYAQRCAALDAVSRIQFWVTDTDPGAASTNMAIINSGVYCDLAITNVINAHLTQYNCGGRMSGRYVVMRLMAHSVGNPGGSELMLGYDAAAPTEPLVPDTPIIPSRDKVSILYGGRPLSHDAAEHRDMLRASGFTALVIFSSHVHPDGVLELNRERLIDDGVYVWRSAWPSEVAAFKSGPTSVGRIEIALGSWGVPDFENIESLIDSQGTGPNSVLYRNFKALRDAVPAIDAVSFDDESNYDVDSSVALALMLIDLGYKVSLCPYTNPFYWISVYNQVQNQRPGGIDRIDLQCYAGGGGNDPRQWNSYFGGLRVTPGLSNYPISGRRPHHVENQFRYWNEQSEIAGGFMWLLDDMLLVQDEYPVSSWAAAINNALGIVIPAPPQADPSNLITTNPGFENGPYGWFTVGGYIDNTHASEGSNSARVVSTGIWDSGEWRTTYGNLTPGDSYRLRFDYKTARGAAGNPHMVFRFYGGGELKGEVQRSLDRTDGAWKSATIDLHCPADAAYFEVEFSVSRYGAFSGTAWLDNVVLNPHVHVKILDMPDAEGGMVIQFDVVEGFDYYVDYRDVLESLPDWQPLPGAPHNSGQAADAPQESQSTRFYRTRREPR